METTALNRAIVQQYFDALNSPQHEMLKALVEPGFVDHAPLPGQNQAKRGGLKRESKPFGWLFLNWYTQSKTLLRKAI